MKHKCFKVVSENEKEEDSRFVKFIIQEVEGNEGMMYKLVQIVDVSKSMLYDQVSAKSQFLTLINATVSHEMKNPLNSILNQTLNFASILVSLRKVIKSL